MRDFSNQLAYITGGSSGIGLETAKLLASKGCSLVLIARGETMLQKACQAVKEHAHGANPSVHIMALDVSDHDEVQKKTKTAVERYGAPDILINCAGIGTADYFENITYEQFDRAMKINVYGTRNMIYALLPFMKQKGRGHIVNVSSLAGLIGMFGYSLYGTTKYAVVGFSECLRSELKRFNIRVTLVCPPEVQTPFLEEEAKTLPPESRAVKNLAGLLTPQQTAKAIVRGIERNKFLVVPGLAAKFLFFEHRLSNGLLTRTPSDWIAAWGARMADKKLKK